MEVKNESKMTSFLIKKKRVKKSTKMAPTGLKPNNQGFSIKKWKYFDESYIKNLMKNSSKSMFFSTYGVFNTFLTWFFQESIKNDIKIYILQTRNFKVHWKKQFVLHKTWKNTEKNASKKPQVFHVFFKNLSWWWHERWHHRIIKHDIFQCCSVHMVF